jgi:hypothetical protein
MVFRSRSLSLAAFCGALTLSLPLSTVAQTPDPLGLSIPIVIDFAKDHTPVPYELDHNLLFFNARIGDTPVRVLLDNGAGSSLIDETLARRLGFQTVPLNQSLIAVDGQQRPQVLAQQIPFRIPGQIDTTTAMLVVDLKPISAHFDHPVDVILGSEFFALAIAIDRAAGTIAFAPSGVANIEGATTIPLSADDIIEAEIAGQPVRLALDLGDSGGASLYTDVFARILPDVETVEGQSMGAFGGLHTVRRAQDVPTTLGQLDLIGPVSEVTRLPGKAGVDGRLGSTMFLPFTVVFDRTAGKILLQPIFNAPPTAPVGPMTAGEIRRRWTTLMARPASEIMASQETSLLIDTMMAAAVAYRAKVRESAAAGAPRACPPEQADLSPEDIVARIGAMSEAEQAEDFGVVLGRIFDARYPCPAA